MRKPGFLLTLWNWFCIVMAFLCPMAAASVAGLNKVDLMQVPEALRPMARAALGFSRSNTWWFVPVATLGAALFSFLSRLGKTSARDAAVKRLLDRFRKDAYPSSKNFMDFRVTLFKHKNWHFGRFGFEVLVKAVFTKEHRRRWPWDGWLVAYERAGSYWLDTKTYFYAPRARVDQAEGYVGLVYMNLGARSVSNLPELNSSSPQADIQAYATATNTQACYVESRIKRGKRMPLSFWGFALEVDAEPWGVLLLDCQKKTLPPSPELVTTFTPIGMSLSVLLSSKQK